MRAQVELFKMEPEKHSIAVESVLVSNETAVTFADITPNTLYGIEVKTINDQDQVTSPLKQFQTPGSSYLFPHLFRKEI